MKFLLAKILIKVVCYCSINLAPYALPLVPCLYAYLKTGFMRLNL